MCDMVIVVGFLTASLQYRKWGGSHMGAFCIAACADDSFGRLVFGVLEMLL